jgi:hypothetical protein
MAESSAILFRSRVAQPWTLAQMPVTETVPLHVAAQRMYSDGGIPLPGHAVRVRSRKYLSIAPPAIFLPLFSKFVLTFFGLSHTLSGNSIVGVS